MVFGATIRRKNKNMVEKVLKKLFDKEEYYDVLPPKKLNKIIDITAKVGKFLLSVALFIATSTVFLKILYVRLGFEKTIILMLCVIIFMFRSFLEGMNKDEV